MQGLKLYTKRINIINISKTDFKIVETNNESEELITGAYRTNMYILFKRVFEILLDFNCKPGFHALATLLQMAKYPRSHLHQSYLRKWLPAIAIKKWK